MLTPVGDASFTRNDSGKMTQITPTPIPAINPVNSPTPTPVPPTPTAAPAKFADIQKLPSPGLRIPYQTASGQDQYVPTNKNGQNIAQALMSVFDPIGAATESASVLAHPWSQTIPPWEQKNILANGGKIWNEGYAGGENRGFQTGKEVDIPNPNGSMDRGLFRINSDTFNGWLNNPTSKQRMAQLGINSYDDMLDPMKNAQFARMLMEATPTASGTGRSWRKWWAAPLELRHPSMFKDLAQVPQQ